jgi:hypothetical protein
MTEPSSRDAGQAVRVTRGDLPGSIGVIPSPDQPLSIGIASEVGRIGGHDWDADRDLGPREAVWALVIEGEPVEGRFVLRGKDRESARSRNATDGDAK